MCKFFALYLYFYLQYLTVGEINNDRLSDVIKNSKNKMSGLTFRVPAYDLSLNVLKVKLIGNRKDIL